MSQIGIILDVGLHMTEEDFLYATQCACAFAEKRLFSRGKKSESVKSDNLDLVAVVFVGIETSNTNYSHISLMRPLVKIDWDVIELLGSKAQRQNFNGDISQAIMFTQSYLVKQSLVLQIKKYDMLIIVLTNLESPMNGDMSKLKKELMLNKTALTLIGPDLEETKNGVDVLNLPSSSSRSPPSLHKQIHSRHFNENLAAFIDILDALNCCCYKFEDALSNFIFELPISTRPWSWKANLTIGDLVIPVSCHSIVKDEKPPTLNLLFAKDVSQKIKTEHKFFLNTGEEVDPPQDGFNKAFKYGADLCPFTASELSTSIKSEDPKEFSVIIFADATDVLPSYLIGDSVMSVFPTEPSETALSALTEALRRENAVAIVRRVFSNGSDPRIGVLMPSIKSNNEEDQSNDPEFLLYTELPFNEDMRIFSFNKFNENIEPNSEQLQVMDEFIDSMLLGSEQTPFIKPETIPNPWVQRFYTCVRERILHPTRNIQELINTPTRSVSINSSDHAFKHRQELERNLRLNPIHFPVGLDFYLDKIHDLSQSDNSPLSTAISKLTEAYPTLSGFKEPAYLVSQKRKLEVSKNCESDEKINSKRHTLDDTLTSFDQNQSVRTIGTIDPYEDFRVILERGDVPVLEACRMYQEALDNLLDDSYSASLLINKVQRCLDYFRKKAINDLNPTLIKSYNNYLKTFKNLIVLGINNPDLLPSSTVHDLQNRLKFWNENILKNKLGLITKEEVPETGYLSEAAASINEADLFLKPSEGLDNDQNITSKDQFIDSRFEDLLDDME